MEVKLKNVKYKDILVHLNMNLNSKYITLIFEKNITESEFIFSIISLFKKIDNGEIEIDNYIVNNNYKRRVTKKVLNNVSYISDDLENYLFNINVLEDLKYGLGKIDYKRLEELLKTFDLSKEILYKNYTELSSSERQKISLISAFLKKAKILLLSNPTKYLDSKSKKSLIRLLKQEKRDGKLVLMYSNDSEFLLQVIDRVIVLNSGEIEYDGNKYGFFSDDSLLKNVSIEKPEIIHFIDSVLKIKNIKLGYRDNINDLIKDIYRNVK